MIRYRAATLSLLIALTAGCSGRHPTDDALTDVFRAKRAGFDRLLALSREDTRLRRVAHDWCADAEGRRYFGPTPGVLSVERWGEYRTLFYDLDIRDGIEVIDGTLLLLVSSSGHGASRTLKGYAHGDGPLLSCDSLDDPEQAVGDGCFRSLGDGWHLFLRKPAT